MSEELKDAILARFAKISHVKVHVLDIPTRVAKNVRRYCAIPTSDELLVVIDNTRSKNGQAHQATVFTLRGIYYNRGAIKVKKGFITYEEFCQYEVELREDTSAKKMKKKICIGDGHFVKAGELIQVPSL